MSETTIDVINKGIRCLTDHMGQMECEIFIATLLRERFDYTEWRKDFVDQINNFEELNALQARLGDIITPNHTADTII